MGLEADLNAYSSKLGNTESTRAAELALRIGGSRGSRLIELTAVVRSAEKGE